MYGAGGEDHARAVPSISVFIRILEDSTVKEYHWESLCMIESMEEAL